MFKYLLSNDMCTISLIPSHLLLVSSLIFSVLNFCFVLLTFLAELLMLRNAAVRVPKSTGHSFFAKSLSGIHCES